MYNIVYTNENPDWPIDIFHRYYVHGQLEPNLVDLKRYLLTDKEIDNLKENTFIYPNGELNDDMINKIKLLLNNKNFIFIWNFDHEAFWGDGIKWLHKFLSDNKIPHEKVFVVQSDINVDKTFSVAKKEYNLVFNVNDYVLNLSDKKPSSEKVKIGSLVCFLPTSASKLTKGSLPFGSPFPGTTLAPLILFGGP